MRKSCLAIAVIAFAGVGPAAADVTISSAATHNMSCSGGVCAPTSSSAVLNVSDLETLLASGAVEVTTTGSGVQANNIAIEAGLSWSTTNTLALDAYQSIRVDHPVTVAGVGGVSVATNDGGSGGAFSFGKKGHVTFDNLSSQLAINGNAYTLVNTVAGLANAGPSGFTAFASDYNASQDGTYRYSPVQNAITGIVEGLGNTISGLKIKNYRLNNSYVGLFAQVDPGGTVENLRLSKIHLDMKGQVYGGGLVGRNEGTLFGDGVSGSAVSNQANVGGLVGANTSDGTITSSWADLNISSCCGGLVGANYGTISLSHADGSVPEGAGFAADNEGTISQSFATGAAGDGFVGYNEEGETYGEIDNSYATGAISGGAGFAGDDDSLQATISSSYSTGAVGSEGAGFVCEAVGESFNSDYWDTTTSGTKYALCADQSDPDITGLTSKQLRSSLPEGFESSIWAINSKINNGFPYLINNPPDK